MATLNKMSSDGYYPSSVGRHLGLVSAAEAVRTNATFRQAILAKIDLAIAGTIGSGSPSYQVEAQDTYGNWAPAKGLVLTATGQVSGYAHGCAFRLNAANGTSPGTGANTPRYFLDIVPVRLVNTGEYAG